MQKGINKFLSNTRADFSWNKFLLEILENKKDKEHVKFTRQLKLPYLSKVCNLANVDFKKTPEMRIEMNIYFLHKYFYLIRKQGGYLHIHL